MPSRREFLQELQRRGTATPAELAELQGGAATPAAPMAAPAAAKPQRRSWLDEVGDFASAAWKEVNPIEAIKGLNEAVKHPIDAATGMLMAQDEPRLKAEAAFKRGDYAEGARHVLGYLIPMLGPGIDVSGNLMQQGEYAKGAGQAVGIGANIVGPGKLAKMAKVRIPGPFPNPNAMERAAVDYLRTAAGVEPGAAASTGSGFVRGAQKLVDVSPGGAMLAARQQARNVPRLQAHAEQLKTQAYPLAPETPYTAGESVRGAVEAQRKAQVYSPAPPAGAAGPGGILATGEQLAGQVYPKPVSPLEAGMAGRGALEKRVSKLSKTADTAYSEVREIAEHPANAVEVQVGTEIPADLDALAQTQAGRPFNRLSAADKQTVQSIARAAGVADAPVPVMRSIAIPVDMRPIKEAIRPIYQRMTKWMEPSKQHASGGLQAMKSILEGDDFLAAVDAEDGLSGLKRLGREGEFEGVGGSEFQSSMRDINQGVGANASRMLQDAIDTAIARAPHEPGRALQMLRRGREVTRGKYEVADIVRQFRKEPVQAFKQLTYAGDAGVAYLNEVARSAPKEMGKIGRALVDDIMNSATGKGDLSDALQQANMWRKLGDKTKAFLIKDPKTRAGLDNYFKYLESYAEQSKGKLAKLEGKDSVPIYEGLLQPRDANVDLLKDVTKLSPIQGQKLGRGWLDQVFEKMTSQGAINHLDWMWNQWNALGDQTKKLIFPDAQHRANLGKFFLGIKKMAENPNPSGSALVGSIAGQGFTAAGLSAFSPVAAAGALATFTLPPAVISAALHSTAGAKLLTEGLTVSGKSAAGAMIASQLAKLAGEGVAKQEQRK